MRNILVKNYGHIPYEPGLTGITLCKKLFLPVENVAAIKINEEIQDLRDLIPENEIELIFVDNELGERVINHSKAHLFAQALEQLFPDIQLGIGPANETEFFYDIKSTKFFSKHDIEKVIKVMESNIEKNQIIEKKFVTREEALDLFGKKKQVIKQDIIRTINTDDSISIYTQGDFIDLCRGPHVFSTGVINKNSFCLKNIAEIEWNGHKLQRVSFNSRSSKEKLDELLANYEECKNNNHINLGKQMDLFFFNEVSPGSVFWLDSGYKIVKKIHEYIRNSIKNYNYEEIRTPTIYKPELWAKSGHLGKYKENMFFVTKLEHEKNNCFDENQGIIEQIEKNSVLCSAIKPMSCPAHVQVFSHSQKSLKCLPKRYAEIGLVHRNEPSGARHGLTRLVEFNQDDGHCFIENTAESIKKEIKTMFEMVERVYKDFGFNTYEVALSTRPEKYIGTPEIWDTAEKAMEDILSELGIEPKIQKGDGAFYGPKFEFILKDVYGRKFQCGTIQLDFFLPESFNVSFINTKGEKERPVMIHRAILGSIERFLAILIEHHKGHFPFWLSPIQVSLIPVDKKVHDYLQEISGLLKQINISVQEHCDKTVSKAIKESTDKKIPVICILGEQEKNNNTVSLRIRGEKKEITKNEFILMILEMNKV